MNGFEIIVILMFAAILLVAIAQKLQVPYPLILVLGGTAIGFIPTVSLIPFEPYLILVIVLPPILYYAAFSLSFREFRKNWQDILSLSLTLVVVTTCVIAVIFKAMFPQYPWALAFAFGAIVSPPDAVSATTILKRFAIRNRLVTLLEGESLVNDASALILYKVALTALLTGVFSFFDAFTEFIWSGLGGVLLGMVMGISFQLFSRNFLAPVLGVVFSFTIPYITFIVASFLSVSGVLAVVVNGLIGARILVTHRSPLRRVLGYATWDIFSILMNCFIFILIGLQLRTITAKLSIEQMMQYGLYALMITAAMIAFRMFWVYSKALFQYWRARLKAKPTEHCLQILKEAVVVGWAGMRGIVSLAAAIGLPLTYHNGEPIEGRSEVIFITFIVILLTLLIPGLTLPALIRWLQLKSDPIVCNPVIIRHQLSQIAEEKLYHLRKLNHLDEKEYGFLKTFFSAQGQVHEMSHAEEYALKNVEKARVKVIQAQREEVIEMWRLREIDDKLLQHLETELDMMEVHIARADL